jgi:hypothetical protein
MIENNTSYGNYATGQRGQARGDRLTIGSALLAVFGLSLLAWAVVLVPFVAILHK